MVYYLFVQWNSRWPGPKWVRISDFARTEFGFIPEHDCIAGFPMIVSPF